MNKHNHIEEDRQITKETNTVDQGVNLVSQIVNNATGIDKKNDGKISEEL